MRLRTAFALMALMLAGCAGFDGPDDTTSSPGPSSSTATVPSTPATQPPSTCAPPVWPEGSAAAVAAALPRLNAGQDPWRAAPEATAEAFGRIVLGWTSPRAERDSHAREYCSSQTYRLANSGRVASITLVPLSDAPRWWAVSYAHLAAGDDVEFNISVHIAGTNADIGAGAGWWTDEVALAELRIGHGLGERILVVTHPPARWVDVELPQATSDTGHLMVIFRSADGQAVAVHATGLPEGDFTAS